MLKGELEGFFLIMMISLLDTFLQNPVGNPAANQDFLKFFPSYGSMQLLVAGEFTSNDPWQYLWLPLAWLGGFALLGRLIFNWKTRVAVQPVGSNLSHPE